MQTKCRYICCYVSIHVITVNQLSINVGFILFNAVPCPEILQVPHNITTLPGQMVNFTCLAYSHTTLQYKWKRTKELLSSSKTTCAQNDAEEYSINITKPSDEGWYCCVATNECGDVDECAWLEMDSK